MVGCPAVNARQAKSLHSSRSESRSLAGAGCWRVSLIKGTPAKFIDFAYAPDAQAAERQVAKEHNISSTLRNRLVAIRDDL